MHHILSVWGDALEITEAPRPEVEAAVGQAVFTLCADPQLGYLGKPKLERVTSAPVLNAGGGVRRAGEVHHTEFAAFVWSRGHLKPLHALSAVELEELSQLVQSATAAKNQPE